MRSKIAGPSAGPIQEAHERPIVRQRSNFLIWVLHETFSGRNLDLSALQAFSRIKPPLTEGAFLLSLIRWDEYERFDTGPVLLYAGPQKCKVNTCNLNFSGAPLEGHGRHPMPYSL